jgi:hypothetical protein
MRRAARGARHVTSANEQRLWLADRSGPAVLNALTLCLAIPQGTSLDALRRAVARSVLRHEALRTTFHEADDGLCRTVHDWLEPELAAISVPARSEQARDEALQELGRALVLRSFRHDVDTPLRVVRVACGALGHYLLISANHLACDLVSLYFVALEIAGAATQPEASPPGVPELHAADFACWQRAALDATVVDRAQEFWRAVHAGRSLRVPLGVAEAGRDRASLRSVEAALPGEFSRRPRKSSRAYAALVRLLSRVSGDTAPAIALPTMNRRVEGQFAIVGYLANALPTRIDPGGCDDPAEVERLARHHLRAIEPYEWIPLGSVAPALRDHLNVVLNHFPKIWASFPSADWRLHWAGFPPALGATFDLGFYLNEAAETVRLHYFESSTATALAREYLDGFVSLLREQGG